MCTSFQVERGGIVKGEGGQGNCCIGFSVQYVYNMFTSLNANRLEWEEVFQDPHGDLSPMNG